MPATSCVAIHVDVVSLNDHQTVTKPPFTDAVEGMPVSKISEIVGASPLSDDDVQELIEQLLEKMTMNAEWQGVSQKSLTHTRRHLALLCGVW